MNVCNRRNDSRYKQVASLCKGSKHKMQNKVTMKWWMMTKTCKRGTTIPTRFQIGLAVESRWDKVAKKTNRRAGRQEENLCNHSKVTLIFPSSSFYYYCRPTIVCPTLFTIVGLLFCAPTTTICRSCLCAPHFQRKLVAAGTAANTNKLWTFKDTKNLMSFDLCQISNNILLYI